jgi:hypothetical protein
VFRRRADRLKAKSPSFMWPQKHDECAVSENLAAETHRGLRGPCMLRLMTRSS